MARGVLWYAVLSAPGEAKDEAETLLVGASPRSGGEICDRETVAKLWNSAAPDAVFCTVSCTPLPRVTPVC